MTTRTDALKTLLTRLVDSRDGYTDALDHVDAPHLKSTLSSFLERRQRNADEIRAVLSRMGVEVGDDGSLLASAHRSFVGIKDILTDGDEAAVLAEIVRGEKVLLDAYDEAITAIDGDAPEFAFLVEQHASLSSAIGELEMRKDLAA
ncbi:hypothetical protein JANAI62_32730 [Jannaschia pagri]|uniref:DUF2383 domain-containing protein n=1 Tax=Jannaschia pagri TaxID=2829797 RepID=A0ABQ4NQG0_9RHOB|nr:MULTISPECIES: PA2169 family four-helix-bundle protein [unclassified Jannaschia]GIT92815.1 hypothetical protein JANAI61_32730 [Jannaschia sp. AI_61]GIT96650.1 hypothetical protein JANAI62_32730 [Jannaschia sp. AI_62]